MDRELEKRLNTLEAKLDKLTKLVEASADPRLVTSAYGQEVLKKATGKGDSGKSSAVKFDASQAPERGSPNRGGSEV